ncbi:Biotin synthase [Corynebacterium ciconiae DSM 44920]|uniref:biotin synthase BioB n=1 Tax=Corynebacterium ciconiae TaxID=227319 RepID=UPI00036BAA72|nr:biotin synthase BioB [Corynebacterium ciconiae]WKD60641.1 Biotin synthase [Corynebacterium ciconiae DSM 44920]
MTTATQDAQGSALDESNILELARTKVLERGEGLNYEETLAVLNLPDEKIEELLELAHEVRVKWCGDEVEVEGIVSLKTGGCPEDCHFCSQSAMFNSPVRAARIDIPELIESAKQTRKTGASEFCIVAAVRGPDERLMNDLIDATHAIKDEVDIEIAASVGMITLEQAQRLKDAGVHRYNHNLETSESYFPQVVTTHTFEERIDTLKNVRQVGMEVCTGGILGLGETREQRAEFAQNLASVDPTEVPMNFLDPRPGTPFADKEPMEANEALRAIGAFRLALPKTTLRFAGGRELTLGDLGAEQGLLGGINAVIVGNYLTTLGRPAETDLDMLGKLRLPIRALNETI